MIRQKLTHASADLESRLVRRACSAAVIEITNSAMLTSRVSMAFSLYPQLLYLPERPKSTVHLQQ